MINKEFFVALDEFEKQNKVDKQVFIESLESGLASAYKKEYGDSRAIEVRLAPEQSKIRVFAYRTVVDEVLDEEKEISLAEAKEIKSSYKVGDVVSQEITPKTLSRIAAQTAIQVIQQRLNDIKKEQIFDEMSKKEGEIVNAIVRRVENNNVYVEIMPNQMEGVLLASEQISGEKYNVNDIIKVLVRRLTTNTRSPQVVVSRSHPDFVRRLFELDIPEIRSGLVTIKRIVREAGARTKIAVYSDDPNVDAVGACIGAKGSRINAIVGELNGERVDVINWCADPLEFIARAISPAKAVQVHVNDDEHSARVIVNDNMLSLAIGRQGQNARLAAKLTEWKIDVKPYSSIIDPMGNSEE